MKTFYNELCKAMYFLFLGALLSSYFYVSDFRSLGSGSMVVPSKVPHTPDSSFLYLPELPSLIDIQRKLNELEPNDPLKVDGRWGKLTCDKWDRVYCNEQAKKYFEGNEK